MGKPYNKPNLNAPRFRPKKLNLTNDQFYKRFTQQYPKHTAMGLAQFKSIIATFNQKIWQTAVDERDGVELPEQLGYLFIGSCPRKKSNVDFSKSGLYGVKLQNQNWESDNYTAKIFYTNYETKYKFRNNDLWGFVGVRDFKRTVGKTYPVEWKKYLLVDNLVKVSRIFRQQKYKDSKTIETGLLMEDYDEFNID